jgi:hypothetical protein
MQTVHIKLEEWEQAALSEMASARGVDVPHVAHLLLAERLIQRATARAQDDRVEYAPSSALDSDRIEVRLRRLFGE